MLRNLSLSNFRSWANSGPINLAPLTGIFGTNSSGKSSLLRFVLMLKQTVESRDRGIQLDLGGRGSYVDLGSMTDVLFEHDTGRQLGWSLCWDEPEWSVEFPSQDFEAAIGQIPVCLAVSHRVDAKTSYVQSMRYSVGAHSVAIERQDAGSSYEMNAAGFDLNRPQGRPYKIGAPVKSYIFPDAARLSYTNAGFVQGFELSFEQAMSKVLYLGPLREDPQRQYTWSGSQPIGVGARGEYVVDTLLAARERNLKVSTGPKSHIRLENYVAMWLQKLGLVESFKVVEVRSGTNLYQVLVRRSSRGAWVPITDVGFGVSQILPVLTLCFAAPPGSTLILEQPEIHLHPKVQSGLADVFLDAIKRRKIQILVESHSEHFMARLLRRIAEDDESTVADTALYFCDNPGTGSTIDRLDVDMFGAIRNWPEGFFGDPLAESLATARAGQAKRSRLS